MEITYTERNGIFYPDLALPKQINYPIGKYGRMRLDFIQKHRRGTYTTILTEGRLNEYLHEIDEQAAELMESAINKACRGARNHRGAESYGSDAVGIGDEQDQGERGGNHTKRDRLSLI